MRDDQIPGDGIDNDKDGLVDEDFCGFLIQGKLWYFISLRSQRSV